MPREAIEKARTERNAALLDAMLLAGSADGELKPVELEQLLKRVLERPEFEGTQADELNALIESSAKRLSQSKRLEEVLESLRHRLPDHHNRLLAFGLATAIALADNKATRDELGLLKTLQSALGVSEDEVSRVFGVVQAGGSLAEALGEPVERLLAETMVIVSASDGVVHEKEILSMLESLAADPIFHGLNVDTAERFVQAAVHNLAHDGLPARLAVLAQGLTTPLQRRKAFQLAVKIAHADGDPGQRERHLLDLLQATFGIADDEAARMMREA